MTYTLFPHQIEGARFLASAPGTKGLFYGMGTGKTVTALEGARQLWDKQPRNILIIAPPIALPMWQREAEAYLDVRRVVILKTGTTPIPADTDVVVVSYAIAAKRSEELRVWLMVGGVTSSTGVLICDESHALKNATAKRTKAVLGKDGIADGAAYSWMLTGTPITRWNDDMFPFLCRADLKGLREFVGQGDLHNRFKMMFTIQQDRKFPGARWPTKMVVGNRNTEMLADWVYNDAELAQRVDLDEVFVNMPPLTQNRYEIPLDADAELKADLKAMEKMNLADLQQQLKSKEPALATIRRRIGLAKVKAAAAEIAERIESGQNVLVGAWHTDVIDALSAALGQKGYVWDVIDGRASAAHKAEVQDGWNAGEINVLICQIAAAGVSLNLQHGGTQIIVVEEDWSPSIMDQFYARLWRYGQQKHVHVDTLVAADNKLEQAVGRISQTKHREHEKFNEIGRAS